MPKYLQFWSIKANDYFGMKNVDFIVRVSNLEILKYFERNYC